MKNISTTKKLKISNDYRKRVAFMTLVSEMEKMIDQRVELKMNELMKKYQFVKPWVKMAKACERLEKEDRWIRDNLCTGENIEKGIVKKIGNEWHFRNPEFFNYVHDVWWSNHK